MARRITIRLPPPDAEEAKRLLGELRLSGEMRISSTVDLDALRHEFETSEDIAKLTAWLASKRHPASEINTVFMFAVTALSEWESLPPRTQVEHRHLYDGITKASEQLEGSMEGTGSFYSHGHGWGMQDIELVDLLSDHELQLVEATLPPGTSLTDLGLPLAGEVVRRLGVIAKAFSDRGTHHAQPTKRGAKRGYFIRRLAGLFQSRYQEVSAEVVAAVATTALGEPTDRELVVKTLRSK